MKVRIIEKIYHHTNSPILSTPYRTDRELFWIKELGTAMPYGCNDNIKGGGNLSKNTKVHRVYILCRKWHFCTVPSPTIKDWNINNCGAGTLGQEKRYMHINVHTLTHIYIRGGGWERTYTYLSGDSSPICKRHLESMLKGIKCI
jgi:hypothetical protein